MKYFVTKLSLCVPDEEWRWQIAWSIGDLAVIVGRQPWGRGRRVEVRFASLRFSVYGIEDSPPSYKVFKRILIL
jgi:hypothetical protein